MKSAKDKLHVLDDFRELLRTNAVVTTIRTNDDDARYCHESSRYMETGSVEGRSRGPNGWC